MDLQFLQLSSSILGSLRSDDVKELWDAELELDMVGLLCFLALVTLSVSASLRCTDDRELWDDELDLDIEGLTCVLIVEFSLQKSSMLTMIPVMELNILSSPNSLMSSSISTFFS